MTLAVYFNKLCVKFLSVINHKRHGKDQGHFLVK